MQNILIVGAGSDGLNILDLLQNIEFMNVKAIIDPDEKAPGICRAKILGIAFGDDWSDYLTSDVHIIIDVTGDPLVYEELLKIKPVKTLLIPTSIVKILVRQFEKNDTYIKRIRKEMNKQRMIFDSIEEGMIGIDGDGRIDFFNKNAATMINMPVKEAIGKLITDVIPLTKLPDVLKVGKSELNQKLTLANGLNILTSRYALLDQKKNNVGAFAVFKDVTDVVALAEEITDLKKVKMMLEAIIHSSDDAISVVDEKGSRILVNPAYTQITGLTKGEVIRKNDTYEISEEENILLKVLQSKEPVRGVHMFIGEKNIEVIVNVAPIVVDGHIKGSVSVIHDLTKMRNLMNELDYARSIIRKLESTYTFDDIYGSSKEISISIEQATLAAGNDVPVLLRGEVGSGKELFAHAIHSGSDRRLNKFTRMNCGKLDLATLEAELFDNKEGNIFIKLVNGTLFLDEITDLPLIAQKKLLHFLTERTIMPNGKTTTTLVSVRIITATSKNLEIAMHEGLFLEELYYILNRISIQIPPLRTRKEDIPTVVNHLLIKLNKEFGMNVDNMTTEALGLLKEYNWPGNVRELENVLSRAMIYMNPGKIVLELEDVMKSFSTTEKTEDDSVIDQKSTLASIMNDYEKSVIKAVLAESNGNKSLAANQLDISLRTLYYKLEKFNLV